MTALPNSLLRQCDHPGCTETYEAMSGGDGWVMQKYPFRHRCPAHVSDWADRLNA